MFLSIRKFKNVKSPEVVIKKVETGLLPVLSSMPGFVNYYATKFEDGDLGSVGIFATKSNADAAGVKTIEWLKQNLDGHFTQEPMILRGEVLFANSQPKPAAAAKAA